MRGQDVKHLLVRCTFTGGVQIDRLPGVVQFDMLVPEQILEAVGLADVVTANYAG